MSRAGIPGGGGGIWVRVDGMLPAASVHRDLERVSRHQDLSGAEPPHTEEPKRAACSTCHQREVERHARSLHGEGPLKSGLVVTAACDDCHTPHRALPPDDPNSSVNSRNVEQTCSQCHLGAYRQFGGRG